MILYCCAVNSVLIVMCYYYCIVPTSTTFPAATLSRERFDTMLNQVKDGKDIVALLEYLPLTQVKCGHSLTSKRIIICSFIYCGFDVSNRSDKVDEGSFR